MTFRSAVESSLRKYAVFGGRASRAEYWWFYLFTLLVGALSGCVDALLNTSAIGALTSIALILPTLAVTVRRLHDSNLSGWWILAPIGLSVGGVATLMVGAILGIAAALGAGPDSVVAIVLVLVGVVLLLVAFVLTLIWMLRRSTDGPNRFGPSPHDPPAAPVYAPPVTQSGAPAEPTGMPAYPPEMPTYPAADAGGDSPQP